MAVDRLKRRLSAGLGTRRSRVARVRPGTPPGTLVAAGAPTPARISVLAENREGATERPDVGVDDALPAVAPGGVTWINVDGLGDPNVLARLGERFGLHPLALEDVLNGPQRPKVERYDKHMFVVLRTMRLADGDVAEEQVSLFFGAGCAAIDDPNPVVLVQMQRLRHQLLTLRRAVWPMREEIGILQREESDLVALEIVESLRETAVSVMEVYLSVQNQRLNEIMKVLTVIATLFIPLTTIASIYGMNFRHMPELEWRYGYAWALGLMLVTALAMLGFFKRKGWW